MDSLGFIFFGFISHYIRDRVEEVVNTTYPFIANMAFVVGSLLCTIWIMINGYQILSGNSRESLMALTLKAGKMAFILAVISGSTLFNISIQNTVLGFRDDIAMTVVGATAPGPNEPPFDIYNLIDSNLGRMQGWIGLVDSINPAADPEAGKSKDRAMTMALVGQAGPAMIGGTMLLLSDISIRMGILFAPIFLLAMVYPKTQEMFNTWVKYMITAMFAMGVLSIVVSISTDVLSKFAIAMGVLAVGSEIIPGVSPVLPELQQSLMQAGLGILISALIITVPPMVSQFFGGALNTAANNSFLYLASNFRASSSNSTQEAAAQQGANQAPAAVQANTASPMVQTPIPRQPPGYLGNANH